MWGDCSALDNILLRLKTRQEVVVQFPEACRNDNTQMLTNIAPCVDVNKNTNNVFSQNSPPTKRETVKSISPARPQLGFSFYLIWQGKAQHDTLKTQPRHNQKNNQLTINTRSSVQAFKRWSLQAFKRSSVQAFKRSSVQAFKLSSVQASKRWSVQVWKRSSVQAFK